MRASAGRVGTIRPGPPQADARHSPLAFQILTLPVVELLLADSDRTTDQRITVAQYLLLDSQDALKERLAQLARISDEAHEGGLAAGGLDHDQ